MTFHQTSLSTFFFFSNFFSICLKFSRIKCWGKKHCVHLLPSLPETLLPPDIRSKHQGPLTAVSSAPGAQSIVGAQKMFVK